MIIFPLNTKTPGFQSCTRIGSKHGLSYAAVKRLLEEEGLIEGKNPSKKAFNEEFAICKLVVDKYSSDLDPVAAFYWSVDKTKGFFPEKSDDTLDLPHIKSRYKAENEFCKAFYQTTEDLGIHIKSLTGDTQQALIECEFGDPHFIGGPCIFNYADKKKMKVIFQKSDPISHEILEKLRSIKKIDAASNFERNYNYIKSWCLKQSYGRP